jgi:hypothetical protein
MIVDQTPLPILKKRDQKMTTNPITKRKIEVNLTMAGSTFKKLMDIGYVYNRDDSTIYAERIIETTDIIIPYFD